MKRSGSASGGVKGRRAGVFYSERMKSNNQPLRNLTQMPYPEVVNITEKNANNKLVKCKVLLTKKGLSGKGVQRRPT